MASPLWHPPAQPTPVRAQHPGEKPNRRMEQPFPVASPCFATTFMCAGLGARIGQVELAGYRAGRNPVRRARRPGRDPRGRSCSIGRSPIEPFAPAPSEPPIWSLTDRWFGPGTFSPIERPAGGGAVDSATRETGTSTALVGSRLEAPRSKSAVRLRLVRSIALCRRAVPRTFSRGWQPGISAIRRTDG